MTLRMKIFTLLLIFLGISASPALASDISIIFNPGRIMSVGEGSDTLVTVTFQDTQRPRHYAPIVTVADSTGFTSTIITKSRVSGDSVTQVSLTVAPGYLDSGVYGIDFVAYDSLLQDTSATLSITVVDRARSPQFINLPDSVSINEGQATTFPVVAIDPDGGHLSYTISPGDISWVTLDTAGSIPTFLIGPVPNSEATWGNPSAERLFYVFVQNGAGRRDTSTFKIKVQNVDRPPQFRNPSRDTIMTVYQLTQGSLTFRAIDPDSAEGDFAIFFDSDNMVATLSGQGWTISFHDSVLNFTPPGNALGLVSPTGFRFRAARTAGAPSDTVQINFNVLDTIPPEAIAVLNVDSVGMTFGTVRLSWNAPREDGSSGGAVSSYQLKLARWAPGGDVTAWFDSIQAISEQPPAPLAPGQPQNRVVSNLVEHQSYWFALRSVDASGNLSPPRVSAASRSRQVRPAVAFLGDTPDTVRENAPLLFVGVAADSGGVISTLRYSRGGTSWNPVVTDSTTDSSSIFIRKFFHFTDNSGTNSSVTFYVRVKDSQDSTTIQRTVFVDNIPPNTPGITSQPDSLTGSNSFRFTGTKDGDATVWNILVVGQDTALVRVTSPGDTRTTWSYTEDVFFQGAVRFSFYATDNAGNTSPDTVSLGFWLVPEPPNIIDTAFVNYHYSTVFNPQVASFILTFRVNLTCKFVLNILNDLGVIVYSVTDSLSPRTDTAYTYSWNGVMNRGPYAGEIAPDGRYLARFSARTYPNSPYDYPIAVELILDSYAPYELEFFPQSSADSTQARNVNNQTNIVLAVGDTGATGYNARAAIMSPYLETTTGVPGSRLYFMRSDSLPGQWTANLQDANLAAGKYKMTLVISDTAGNENRYLKYYEVTADRGIRGFLNYPNPFAPSREVTKITYVLGQQVSDLTLEIFDSSGDLAYRKTLDGAYLTPQAHEYEWDGRSSWGKMLNNGVYFARLKGDVITEFLKIAIVDR